MYKLISSKLIRSKNEFILSFEQQSILETSNYRFFFPFAYWNWFSLERDKKYNASMKLLEDAIYKVPIFDQTVFFAWVF